MRVINELKGHYRCMEEVDPGEVVEYEGYFFLIDDSEEAFEGVNLSTGEIRRFSSDDEVIVREGTVTIGPEAD